MIDYNQSSNIPTLPPAMPGFEHVHRFWDDSIKKFIAKVKPGEFYVTFHDEAIMTILGSCVSACIREVSLNIGGINHFMLPLNDRDLDKENVLKSDAARYGNWAMEFLINAILKAGGKRRNLEIKIFGGGNIMGSSGIIGKNNIKFVLEYLYDENLNLVAQDVGDMYARQLIYYPLSGRAQVKKLKSQQSAIIQQEQQYFDQLQKKPNDDIELF